MPTIWDSADLLCYNVIDGGATGNGTTDDSAAIAATIATAAGHTHGATVIFTAPTVSYRLSNNVTVPANVTVVFFQGAMLSLDAGKTFTVNGKLSADAFRIFSGYGTPVLTSCVDAVFPEWFGAVHDGTTDDTAVINLAIAATPTNGIIAFVPGATYYIKGNPALNFNHQMGIRFNGCQFLYDDDYDAIVIGGASTVAVFESWYEGHVEIVRGPNRYAIDGSLTPVQALKGSGIHFRNTFTYLGKGSSYTKGFKYGYYFDGDGTGCTAMAIHGAQTQDCLIDFFLKPAATVGSYVTSIEIYSPYSTYPPPMPYK